jgi:hypothetical protein
MPIKIVIATPPVVVRVISPGPSWLTLLVTFLLGAALTFAVQIYVVPRVAARKRRRERWEKDVLEIGELLSTTVTELAKEARSAQLRVRLTSELAGDPNYDQEWVTRELREMKPAAREAKQKLADAQIMAHRASDMLGEYFRLSLLYGLHLVEHHADELWELPDEDFEAWWERERELRAQLISSVARVRRLGRLGRKPVEASATPVAERSAN